MRGPDPEGVRARGPRTGWPCVMGNTDRKVTERPSPTPTIRRRRGSARAPGPPRTSPTRACGSSPACPLVVRVDLAGWRVAIVPRRPGGHHRRPRPPSACWPPSPAASTPTASSAVTPTARSSARRRLPLPQPGQRGRGPRRQRPPPALGLARVALRRAARAPRAGARAPGQGARARLTARGAGAVRPSPSAAGSSAAAGAPRPRRPAGPPPRRVRSAPGSPAARPSRRRGGSRRRSADRGSGPP